MPSDPTHLLGPHRYVVVEGPIGVGKTTLVHRMAERVRARLVLESVEENPFLAHFYQDRSTFAFQTELFFLLSRFRQQQQVTQESLFAENILSDYLFEKNLIFSGLTLSEAEWKLYLDIYEALAPQVVTPDLVVVLDASLPLLVDRIHRRGRSFEASMDEAYLDALARRYRRAFQVYDAGPVLLVDTTHLDLSRDDDAVDLVMHEIALSTSGTRTLS
ncbi:MAG: deoxynucleoside kinase [Deltaproteobacteria bacterium]|nr:deoxynucleoside kinase [Deltaproteobacteria bacterium]